MVQLPGDDDPIHRIASGNEDPSEEITVLEARRNFPDEKVLELIRKDGRYANKDETKLIRKLRKYFDSVISSQGFECRFYPGPIWGIRCPVRFRNITQLQKTRFNPATSALTTVEPKQYIIHHPVANSHIYLLAGLALDCFNHGDATKLRIGQLLTVNAMKETSHSFTYYITFIVRDEYDVIELTLQAKVHDEILKRQVIFCREKQI